MTDMPEKDWVEDDALSAEETMRRFETLGPEPTSPRGLRPRRHLSKLYRITTSTRARASVATSWPTTSTLNQPNVVRAP